ncbi:MAG: hypothetical protein ACRDRJ_19050, partial [Streptosporangiaceae bacterium]
MKLAEGPGVGKKDIVDGSQEQPDAPAWLRALPATAHAYVNAQAESERAAADASLMRIAGSEALRQAPPGVRLSVRDMIAEAYFARNMHMGEAAALDSAVTVGLAMAEDAIAQFGVGSSEAAAAMTAAGYYLANRALDLGDPWDTERSISLLCEVMDNGAVPAGKRLWLFSGLGTALWARYSRSHGAGVSMKRPAPVARRSLLAEVAGRRMLGGAMFPSSRSAV